MKKKTTKKKTRTKKATTTESPQLVELRASLDRVLEMAVKDGAGGTVAEVMQLLSGDKPWLPVTGFHMRNGVDGKIEVLAQVFGKWVVVFAKDGPGPTAVDRDQLIDHMIHAGGIANLRDHGRLHV